MRYAPFGFLLLTLVLGCGGGAAPVPVSGKVTLNGDPADHCTVTFYPMGDTQGTGGGGVTDSTGKYEARSKGGNGLPPGEYKVTISRRLNPDGSKADPNVPPIESPARETLPALYTAKDQTKLSLNVPAGGTTSGDFVLKATVKK
jgi:hypothetical protein